MCNCNEVRKERKSHGAYDSVQGIYRNRRSFRRRWGLFGKVMGICSLISYERRSVEELVADFQGAVDAYLEACKLEGKEPETVTLGEVESSGT